MTLSPVSLPIPPYSTCLEMIITGKNSLRLILHSSMGLFLVPLQFEEGHSSVCRQDGIGWVQFHGSCIAFHRKLVLSVLKEFISLRDQPIVLIGDHVNTITHMNAIRLVNHTTVEPPLSGLPRYGHLLQPGSYIWNFDLSIIHIM